MSKGRITLESDADGLDVAEDFGARPIVSDGTRSALGWRPPASAAVAVGAVVGGAARPAPRPGRRGLFLVVVGLAQLLAPLATFGDPRFKMPIYPTLAVCTAVALVAAGQRLRAGPHQWRGGSGRPGRCRHRLTSRG